MATSSIKRDLRLNQNLQKRILEEFTQIKGKCFHLNTVSESLLIIQSSTVRQ